MGLLALLATVAVKPARTKAAQDVRLSPAAIRRSRLNHFADIMENYSGPLLLMSRIELATKAQRARMRLPNSPLAVAYADPTFKALGLADDRFGTGRVFLGLTPREAHELVCDCHYFGPINGHMVAHRARWMADHPSLLKRINLFFARFV